jgi:two-component system, chemotaxis family, chemotaxis protein CheV
MSQILIFKIDDHNFGLHLIYVERVIPAIEVHPYPSPQPMILGMIYLYPQLIPVINMRHLLGLNDRDLTIDDHMIICHHELTTLALWVDQVEFISSLSPQPTPKESSSPLSLPFIQMTWYERDQPIFMLDFSQILSFWNSHQQDQPP